jgi:hypothetical protein
MDSTKHITKVCSYVKTDPGIQSDR